MLEDERTRDEPKPEIIGEAHETRLERLHVRGICNFLVVL